MQPLQDAGADERGAASGSHTQSSYGETLRNAPIMQTFFNASAPEMRTLQSMAQGAQNGKNASNAKQRTPFPQAERCRQPTHLCLLTLALSLGACMAPQSHGGPISSHDWGWARGQNNSASATPILSRSGTTILSGDEDCRRFLALQQDFRKRYEVPEDGSSVQRLITALETSGDDINYWSLQHAPLAGPLAQALIDDNLGFALYLRFGDQTFWPRALTVAYIDYVICRPDAIEENEQAIDAHLRSTGETSLVVVETNKMLATVRYIPALFAKTQIAEYFAKPTTPSKQPGVAIGRYRIWTERHGNPTSFKDRQFWIIGQEQELWIEEGL